MNSTAITSKIEELKSVKSIYKKLGNEMLLANGSNLFPFDIFVNAILHRSLNLTNGFCVLIENRNLMSAGALLRLQIDNCIRLYAGFIVNEPHQFALDVLDGHQINRMKDRDGNIMKDSYLVNRLSKEAKWLPLVYRKTSGYIHFSSAHIFNATKSSDDKSNCIEFVISEDDPFIKDDTYIEAIEAFGAATELLLRYVRGWIYTKDNPEIVEQMKREYIEKYGHEPSC